MFETYFVSFGVAVIPSWTAESKYSRISRHCRVFPGAAPVALVDHDEVEEVRGELVVDRLVVLVTHDRLVEREVDLVGRVDPADAPVDELRSSFVIASPNGRKSLTMVWSTRMLRSARNSTRLAWPLFQSRQMMLNAVYVLPVPVAIDEQEPLLGPRRWPRSLRLIASCW